VPTSCGQKRPYRARHVPDSWDEGSNGDDALLDDGAEPSLQVKASSEDEMATLCKPEQTPEHGFEVTALEVHCVRNDKAESSSSGHSRLRKDLVNLNKSIAKWLAQEASGHMTRGELHRRISASSAAKLLRACHGAHFREADFVSNAIARHKKQTD